MKITDPKIKSTECSPDHREWVPSSLDNLLREIEHISKSIDEEDSVTLFRGQSNYLWPLDSTFVRDSIQRLFNIEDYQKLPKTIRHQASFHRVIASLMLLKFGNIWKPSKEAYERETSDSIDPWYELLKNIQQYPEKYTSINFSKGTFFIDWTLSEEIGLYFAVFNGVRGNQVISPTSAALWIYDSSSTGNILQEIKLGKLLKMMTDADFLNGDKTFPLMFHPQKQTKQLRATNQKPIYIAQMDFRYDLADVWASYELQKKKKVFVKLIILESVKHDLANHLELKGITEEYVYPQ